ncbi:ABC transporter permease [Pseudemcibacter aquimaris]|uniref:ABC transporter permease n=1 Tax=Pseudemcibacter aquimaris TaxID=2857064 RepID=UPI0020138FA9|nr:FtsX-like permease family protein [Pseudemcibacter aquimaris]MCC3860956.1 FtsX-like permease family protein [Pseudemcibacter aquimaris]WDU59774.1 FtsX-like permease family protein [Pseudemcibacter aquimaris]
MAGRLVSSLNRKLLRDLWKIKGQLVAIVLVMASGIMSFVLSFGVIDSLELGRDVYYDRYQFAEVWAGAKRVPDNVREQIAEIDGVTRFETRVTFGGIVQVDGMEEPATGRIISVPDGYESTLNKLYLKQGRWLLPDEEDAILASEAFVNAHEFILGDTVDMIINGKKRTLKIVGVVLSPEYVYAMGPGALIPDDKRFGVFWMSRRALEAAVNMDGAFNDVSLMLGRDANVSDVKSELDRILKPYGGLISFDRSEQMSNWFVENELTQLETTGSITPVIFLAVAAFLINVVMTRQVATQRVQIGMLKAVGYRESEIALHFLKMVMVIVSIGSVIGLIGGVWLGAGLLELYGTYFRFPDLRYIYSIDVMVFAVFLCAGSATAGTWIAMKQAASLPPAEAMRPESPTEFKETILERIGVDRIFSFLSRIVLRQVERRPIRALLSSIGVGFALSILIFANSLNDSVIHMMNIQYDVGNREDLMLSFVEPRHKKALEEIRLMPGVMKVEPLRDVPVELSHGHLAKRTGISGIIPEPDLHRMLDQDLNPVELPANGFILSRKLAEILNVQIGDVVKADVLEEKRPELYLPVTAIYDEFMGIGAMMDIERVNSLLNEGPVVTGAALMIDPNWNGPLYQNIKEIPSIIGMTMMDKMREIFEQLMDENMMRMMAVYIVFAGIIAFGVIYNTARIAFSERSRELASLRVLGLTRGEVAYILFGELAIVVLIAIPIGMLLGYAMVAGMIESLDTELFRIPLYIKSNTYAYAVIVVLISTLISFYLVWRQVDKIDLVTAQKGVE